MSSDAGNWEQRLLNEFQRDFPITSSPYADIARRLNCTEEQVLEALARLTKSAQVSRVGAVFAPRRIGHSQLVALAVPHTRLDEVAAMVSSLEEVNHNYEREHSYNLWFVVTAETQERVESIVTTIEQSSGLEALRLPLERAYHIDLAFPLWC